MKVVIILLLAVVMFHDVRAENISWEKMNELYQKSYNYENMQKTKEAIRVLSKVYESMPNDYTINYRLGWLFYLNKNYANAMEHLKTCLRVIPASIEALNTMNLVYAARNEWGNIEKQSLAVLKMDYYNQNANYWYSFALKKQKKYDMAIKVANKMLAVFPTSVTFLQERAENLYLSGKEEEGVRVFKSVVLLDPNNNTALYYLNKNRKK